MSSKNGQVFEFSGGSGSAKNLNLKLAGSAGIAFDGAGHLLVADIYNKTVNVYSLPATKPLRRLKVGDTPWSIAFTKAFTSLFVISSTGNVYSIAYATGKVNLIPQLGADYRTVALSPAAYP